MADSPAAAIRTTIDAFADAFNRNDLDAVMAAFADDAEYRPGDGSIHRGRAAIRAAFAPQFTGAFGAKLRYAGRAGWYGVDVFHFDPAGLITRKYTYANYGRPRLDGALGVAL